MAEQDYAVRYDTVRHNIGTCPACRGYVWAEVTIETKTAAPILSLDGKASAYVCARPVAMTTSHECSSIETARSDAREPVAVSPVSSATGTPSTTTQDGPS